jgi:hypothetical protein
MAGRRSLKWILLGAGALTMLLKVVLLMRFDQSRKFPMDPTDNP